MDDQVPTIPNPQPREVGGVTVGPSPTKPARPRVPQIVDDPSGPGDVDSGTPSLTPVSSTDPSGPEVPSLD